MRWIGFVPGLILVGLTGKSILNTLLIPRANTQWLTGMVARTVTRLLGILTSRIRDYARRDNLWSVGPPTFLIGLLTVWLTLLVIGFGLMMWPFTSGTFSGALKEAGSSVFTLGFDVSPNPNAAPIFLVFVAAASGLTVIALQIAYLPSLYAAFNRRETLVTLLETQAGVPAWGPEILIRYQLIENVEQLGRLYDRWTEWAADLSESHTSYRTLVYFRSPDPMRSWLLGLLSVLDAAALQLALTPQSVPAEARPLMRIGYLTLRKIAQYNGIKVDNDPQPDGALQLTRADFDHAVEQVISSGWLPERDLDEAWLNFHGWRINYEAAAYGLALLLDVVPALWSGPRRDGAEVMRPVRPVDRRPENSELARPRADGTGPQPAA